MAKFSVIVTTYNCENTFERCLRSICSQDYNDYEVIVCDSSPGSLIHDTVQNFSNVKYFKTRAVERSEKRNEGVQKACGDCVVIIDSDMILDPNVLSKCNVLLNSNSKIKLICIPERSTGDGYWSKCKAMERSFYDTHDWMQAARVIHRDTFMEFNGYNPKNVGSEDYELPRRIGYKYNKECIGMVSSFITQDEGRLNLVSQLRKKFYYSKSFLEYSQNQETMASFKQQTSLLRRYGIFLSNFNSGIRNPLVYLGVFVLKTLEFAAGGLGYIFYRLKQYATQ